MSKFLSQHDVCWWPGTIALKDTFNDSGGEFCVTYICWTGSPSDKHQIFIPMWLTVEGACKMRKIGLSSTSQEGESVMSMEW